jgi:predicted RNase H-like HicB family nuclease
MARGTLEFSSVVSKEGGWYVATCLELGVTSQGKSVEESLDNLREAIELYLEDEDAIAPASNYRPLVTVLKVGRA